MINEQRSTTQKCAGRPLLFYSLIFEIAHCLADNTVQYGVLTVEVSATSNDRKTNRRVLVASLSIQKVQLNIYQDADPEMIENLIKLLVDHAS